MVMVQVSAKPDTRFPPGHRGLIRERLLGAGAGIFSRRTPLARFAAPITPWFAPGKPGSTSRAIPDPAPTARKFAGNKRRHRSDDDRDLGGTPWRECKSRRRTSTLGCCRAKDFLLRSTTAEAGSLSATNLRQTGDRCAARKSRGLEAASGSSARPGIGGRTTGSGGESTV